MVRGLSIPMKLCCLEDCRPGLCMRMRERAGRRSEVRSSGSSPVNEGLLLRRCWRRRFGEGGPPVRSCEDSSESAARWLELLLAMTAAADYASCRGMKSASRIASQQSGMERQRSAAGQGSVMHGQKDRKIDETL